MVWNVTFIKNVVAVDVEFMEFTKAFVMSTVILELVKVDVSVKISVVFCN